MKNRRAVSLRGAAGLGVLTAFGFLMLGAVPAFAWTSTLVTTPLPSSSVAVGTTISDSAALTLTAQTGTPSGTIIFYLFAGTCTSVAGSAPGSALYTHSSTVGSSNNGATVTYSSGTFSTTGKAAGNYVWLVRYSGGGGWPGTPTTGPLLSDSTTNHYDCEPFA